MISNDVMVETLEESNIDILVSSTKQNVFYTSGIKVFMQWVKDEGSYCIWTQQADHPILVFPAICANLVASSDRHFDDLYSYGDFHYFKSSTLTEADEAVLKAMNKNPHETELEALRSAIESVRENGSTIGIEKDDLSPTQIETIADAANTEEIIDAGPLFTELRSVKSPEEIQLLKRSVEITEEAIEKTVTGLEPGITENEFARQLKASMMKKGAFSVPVPNVSFGSNTAHTMSIPYEEYGLVGNSELQEGDVIRIDSGCIYKGYWSDIARTYSFRTITPEHELLYELLHSINEKAISLLQAGADTGEIYDITLKHAKSLGAEHEINSLANFNRHHFGHGIGIDVYDSPIIAPENGRLESGMVLNIETPFYELGNVGMNVEDTIVIQDDGIKRLSNYADSLQVV